MLVDNRSGSRTRTLCTTENIGAIIGCMRLDPRTLSSHRSLELIVNIEIDA